MLTVTLVPLSLGELLDQTFSYFRKHFWLFAGIMVLPEGLLIGLNILVQIYLSSMALPQNPRSHQATAQSVANAMRAGLAYFGILIPYFIVYALALGAATYALSEVYLGRKTTIHESYRIVQHRLGRILSVIFSIALRTFGIIMLVTVLLVFAVAATAPLRKASPWVTITLALIAILALIIAGILTVIFLVRYSVAVPALVLERLSARQALKRSVALTKGCLWRLLVVGILMTLIRVVLVSFCQAPFTVAGIVLSFKGVQPGLWLTIPSLLLGGVTAAAVAPLLMISFAIAYYDLRVRKEGFDLQLMMSDLDQTTPPGATRREQITERNRLEDSSVFGAILLTILTGGIYQAIWFMSRRKALNGLHSQEKLGMGGLIVALAVFTAGLCLPIAGSFIWGSWVNTENALGPLHSLILLMAGIIIVVQCFKVRRILLDHLAPRQEGVFAASIGFQNEGSISRMGTLFFGIFYLQHEINSLLDRLTSDGTGQKEMISQVPSESSINA